MLSPDRELAAVAELLASQETPFALVGGWAVNSWGFLRASEDIDFLVELPHTRRRKLLAALAADWDAQWTPAGQDDPLAGMIRAQPKRDGLRVDMLVARNAADRNALSRAKTVKLGKTAIPLVGPEDLIAMKLEAGGGQDYEDVRRLLTILAGRVDEALLGRCCKERRVAERLALAKQGFKDA